MHTPVLLQQTVQGLQIRPGQRFIDATVGEGGHLQAIRAQGGIILGLEWDVAQAKKLSALFASDQGIQIKLGNFADIQQIAHEVGFESIDGVLFDFGLSMEQIKNSNRGFSFKNPNEPLDMRINSEQEKTAELVLNTYPENELTEMFIKNAEMLHAKSLSRRIISARVKKRFKTVGDLNKVIEHFAPGEGMKARIFQALRIEVNNEFNNIRAGLEGALNILKSGGKLAIISFHSREDRIVKLFGRQYNLLPILKVTPQNDVQRFERSATLRIYQKP